jgi:hypothetical protein
MMLASVVLVGVFFLLLSNGSDGLAEAASSRFTVDDIKEHFDGKRAFGYLKQICDIGPRRSGSPGMAKQQKLIIEHFKKLGAEVELQEFTARDPRDGRPVPMTNLIVHWLPKKKERVLICTHYDTLPYPILDPHDRRGAFIGANDGGSGVALLMELGNQMSKIKPKYGVDFAFFDGEEYVFNDQRDPFFLGSEHFAKQYRNKRRDYRYRWGVLVDMIGDKNLRIYKDRYSVRWRDTRPLVQDIWATADRLGVREFVPRVRRTVVNDDHVPLHDIGGIPTCDIIDFDYPYPRKNYWHTTADTIDKCSALSLAKVGWVVRAWLETAK